MVLCLIIGLMIGSPAGTDSLSLEGAIRAAIDDRATVTGEEIIIDAVRIPRLTTPWTTAGFSLEPLPSGRWGGHVVVMADLTAPNLGTRRIPVSCTVRTFAEALVASRQLDRHADLTNGDLAARRVETTHLPEDFLRPGAALGGLRTQRIIKEGAVLYSGMLESEPAIRAGDAVTLRTRTSGVRVSVSAVAREDGRIGGTITVQQAGGHLRFRGKVIDTKTVEREIE